MSVKLQSLQASVATAALVLTLGACDRLPAAPTGPDPLLQPAMASTSSPVLTVQLRTVPGFVPLGWGHLQIRPFQPGDPCVPPNPIVPVGQVALSVCGKIFNEGGALYVGGGLWTVPIAFDELPILIASFNGPQAPVDPCRRYELGGYITLPDGVASNLLASPRRYQVLFDAPAPNGVEGRIGGLLDGSAWGPTGVKLERDAFFSAKVCAITITP